MDELDKMVRNSLSYEERSFLDENNAKYYDKNIFDLYTKQLKAFWKNIEIERSQNTKLIEFKNSIGKKIKDIYSSDKDKFKLKSNLDIKFRESLKNEEKDWINNTLNDFYIRLLDNFLNDINSEMDKEKEEKKKNFKENIKNKIMNVYLNNKESINDDKKLKLKAQETFKEEQNLLDEFKELFENEIKICWEEIRKKKENEIEIFKKNLDSKIESAYKLNEDTLEKEKLNKLIEDNFLFEGDKELLKQKDINEFYNLKLDNFCNKIKKEREEKLTELEVKKKNFLLDIENRISKVFDSYDNISSKDELDTKLKELLNQEEEQFFEENQETYKAKRDKFWEKRLKEGIFSRINSAYQISKYSEEKEEFENAIRSNLKLTEEENELLKKDSISEEFEKKIELLWNSSEKERGMVKLIKEQDEKLKRLEDSNKEKEDLFTQKENEIKNLIEIQNKERENFKAESDKKQKEFDEIKEKMLNDSKSQIEAIEKKIKEEKDEEARKREEEKQAHLKKVNEINTNFYKGVDSIKLEEIKKIKNKIKENENEFCIEQISKKIDKESINKIMDQIFENDKIVNFILNKLKLDIDNNKDKIKNAKHLNIVLVGPSGVGKSTLINAVLEDKVALVGFGNVQTKGIDYFESEKISFLRLADTQGIEKNVEYGVSGICKKIQDFIDNKLKEEPDKYVHCIWYCWKGTRLEDSEVNVLKILSEQYKLDKLPVIIVYTNAYIEQERIWAEEYVKNALHLTNNFIPVLSQDITIDKRKIHQFGLDILIDTSIKLAKQAVKSSCYEGLKKEIKDNINEEINKLTEAIKKNIDNEIKKINNNIDNINNFEDFYKDNLKLILNVYYKYIFLNSEINIENSKNLLSISNGSKKLLNDFVVDYYKEILKIKDENSKELFELYAEKLTNDIITYQLNYNIENQNLLQCSWNKNDLKITILKFILENISQDLEKIALKNAFKFLIEPLLGLFGDYFISMYQLGMELNDFEEMANKVISISFEELEKKINDYSESKKKQYEESLNKEDAPTPQELKLNATKNHLLNKFLKNK